MPPRHKKAPKYRLHKQSGQAIVTVRMPGMKPRDMTLGPYNSAESIERYKEILTSIQLGHSPTAAKSSLDSTINEIIAAFWKHAEQHYRRADGTTTSELVEYKYALQCLRKLAGTELAASFGPLKLQAVRDEMLARKWSRKVINARVRRLKHVFKWAVSQELVPASVYHGLATVSGLQRGRTTAKDYPKVKPVSDATVEATLPYLSRQVAGMVRVHRLLGCRPDEVCRLRMCEVDTSGDVWKYRPPQHKLTYRGDEKTIFIGPKAQAIIREFMPDDPTDYVFSPQRAIEERNAIRRAERVTPLYPSHQSRYATARKKKPKVAAGPHYTTHSYDRAIARAVEVANDRKEKDEPKVEHWSPNQLRHARGTEVRERDGIETAQATLGHHRMSTTELYAEKNEKRAEQVARETG